MAVLIVDDEKNIRATLSLCLEGMGCTVTSVGTPDGALQALERESFSLAFLDLRLDGASGLDILPRMLAVRPGLSIVIITAYAAFDTAVRSLADAGANLPNALQVLLTYPFTNQVLNDVKGDYLNAFLSLRAKKGTTIIPPVEPPAHKKKAKG